MDRTALPFGTRWRAVVAIFHCVRPTTSKGRDAMRIETVFCDKCGQTIDGPMSILLIEGKGKTLGLLGKSDLCEPRAGELLGWLRTKRGPLPAGA
jgi:hypothetical protein